ncbi:MAG: methionine/alanine import family NSS transporter small subunit [Dermatophilaceae bacterium]
MSAISIVMMILFMAVIWGGLLASLISLARAPQTEASREIDGGSYVTEHD